MNGTFVISNENLTRVETARLRQALIAMRDELVSRSGDLDRIRKKQVDSAIRKLDKGGFGICEACARPMLKARLIEKPYVRYCVSCF
jgi:RNA polymerase-binding transcription factor DksA